MRWTNQYNYLFRYVIKRSFCVPLFLWNSHKSLFGCFKTKCNNYTRWSFISRVTFWHKSRTQPNVAVGSLRPRSCLQQCVCLCYNVVDFWRFHLDVDKRLILSTGRRSMPDDVLAQPVTVVIQLHVPSNACRQCADVARSPRRQRKILPRHEVSLRDKYRHSSTC